MAAKRAETKAKFAELLGQKSENDFFQENADDVAESSDDDVEGNVEFEMSAPKSDDSDDLISDEDDKPKKKRKKIEEKTEPEGESDKRQREELELLFSSSDEESKQKHFDLREEERERRLAAKKERKKKFKSKLVRLKSHLKIIKKILEITSHRRRRFERRSILKETTLESRLQHRQNTPAIQV